MRLLISIIILINTLLFPSHAYADDNKARVKFYNFDQMLIDGEVKKPTGLLTDTKQAVKFDRLLTMKRSFIDKLIQTEHERVLK